MVPSARRGLRWGKGDAVHQLSIGLTGQKMKTPGITGLPGYSNTAKKVIVHKSFGQNGAARMLPTVSPPANCRNVLTLLWSIVVQERHEPVADLLPRTWLQPNPDRSCTSLAGLPIVQHQVDVAEKSPWKSWELQESGKVVTSRLETAQNRICTS